MFKKIILLIIIKLISGYNFYLWKKVNKPSNVPLKYNYFDYEKNHYMEVNKTDLEKFLDNNDSY